MQIAIGVSTAPDARQAAVGAAAHARGQVAGAAPSLAVLFGSRSNLESSVIESIGVGTRSSPRWFKEGDAG